MKKWLSALILFISIGCSNTDGERNPFLGEQGFSFDINLNLPLYAQLTNDGGAIYIGSNTGIRGIFVINSGFGNFLAWEASCPNHTPNSCSTMALFGGTNVRCSCENFEYSLFNGALLNPPDNGSRVYPLLNYRVTRNGNNLRVFN